MIATVLQPSRRRTVGWVLLGALAVALLVFATVDRDDDPLTTSERTYALASEFACPKCQGQSIAESDIPIAREIRNEITLRLEQGQTEDQIRDYLVSIYGENIDYKPRATGVTGLVWVIPVVAVVVALAGLAAVFQRWRREERRFATDEDRALVAQALQRQARSDGT
ncbi:MAG TPA: cytochrome c-type biogenesis protein [Acidimicrobiales bacterium]